MRTLPCATVRSNSALDEWIPFLVLPAGDRRRQTTLGFYFRPLDLTSLLSGKCNCVRQAVVISRQPARTCDLQILLATRITTLNQVVRIAQHIAGRFYPMGCLRAKRKLAATRTTGQTWDDFPTRARLHTVRDWQRALIRWWCVGRAALARPRPVTGRSRTSSSTSICRIRVFGNIEFAD